MKQIYVVLKSALNETDDWHTFSGKLLAAYTDRGNALTDANQSDMFMEAFDANVSHGRFYFDTNLTQDIPVIR